MRIINDIDPTTYRILRKWLTKYSGHSSLFTASSAGMSERKILLNQRHRAHEDPEQETVIMASSAVKGLTGSLVHLGYMLSLCETEEQMLALLRNEPVETDTVIMEKRFFVEIEGRPVSAQPDIYYKESRTVCNIKTNNYGVWLWDTDDLYKENWQVNTEAFVLRENGYPVEKGMLRFLFTDWTQYQKAKHEGRSFPSGNKFPNATEEKYLDLLDHEEVRSLLTEKAQRLIALENVPDDDLPECSSLDTGERPPWGVHELKKDGDPKANCVAGGRFHSRQEAEQYRDKLNEAKGKPHTIVYSQGLERNLCQYWCDANKFCNHYQEFLRRVEAEKSGGKS